AERLHARIAALRRRLDVSRRLASHAERGARHRHRDAERRARAGLAIGAVADRRLLGIGLAFDRDVAAVARAVDLHSAIPILERIPFLRNRNTLDNLCSAHIHVGEPGATSPEYALDVK